MTHPTYTQQALCCYTLPRLKRIATELGVTPTLDKRAADTWVNAIITHQSAQTHKVADNQTTAQAELDRFIASQAQAIAPEALRSGRYHKIKSKDLKRFLQNPPQRLKNRIAAIDKEKIEYLVGKLA